MIDAVAQFLSGEVNSYLLRRVASSLVRVIPGPIAKDDGTWAVSDPSIALSLINVEEERALMSHIPGSLLVQGNHVQVQPELRVNLQMMFAVRHSSYDHALRYLSYVLTYFQSHPVFTPDAFPALHRAIDRLSVELISCGADQLNQIWAYLGARYLPSVVYRVRVVVLQDVEPMGIGPPILSIGTREGQR